MGRFSPYLKRPKTQNQVRLTSRKSVMRLQEALRNFPFSVNIEHEKKMLKLDVSRAQNKPDTRIFNRVSAQFLTIEIDYI